LIVSLGILERFSFAFRRATSRQTSVAATAMKRSLVSVLVQVVQDVQSLDVVLREFNTSDAVEIHLPDLILILPKEDYT
jgi:hypothetical protein